MIVSALAFAALTIGQGVTISVGMRDWIRWPA